MENPRAEEDVLRQPGNDPQHQGLGAGLPGEPRPAPVHQSLPAGRRRPGRRRQGAGHAAADDARNALHHAGRGTGPGECGLGIHRRIQGRFHLQPLLVRPRGRLYTGGSHGGRAPLLPGQRPDAPAVDGRGERRLHDRNSLDPGERGLQNLQRRLRKGGSGFRPELVYHPGKTPERTRRTPGRGLPGTVPGA